MTTTPIRPTHQIRSAREIAVAGLSDSQAQQQSQQPTAADLSPGNPYLDPASEEAWLIYSEHRVCRVVNAQRGLTVMSEEAIKERLPGWLNAAPNGLAAAFRWDRAHAPQAQQQQEEEQQAQAQEQEQRTAAGLSPHNPWLDPTSDDAWVLITGAGLCRHSRLLPGLTPKSDDELRGLLPELLNADPMALDDAWAWEEREKELQSCRDDDWIDVDSSSNDSSSDNEPSDTSTQETVTVEHQPQPQQETAAAESVEQGDEAQQEPANATGYVDPVGYKGSFGTVGVPLRAEAICFNLRTDDNILFYWGRVYQWLKHKGGSAAISRHDAAELLGINKDAWKKFTDWAKAGEWLEVVSTRNKVNTYTFGRAFLEADWVSINAEAQRQLDARRKRDDRKRG